MAGAQAQKGKDNAFVDLYLWVSNMQRPQPCNTGLRSNSSVAVVHGGISGFFL